MQTATPTTPDQHHRLPAEIISHGVWLYFRCCLSDREVEERRFARGLLVTYEASRKWCVTVGQPSAKQLRRRHPRPGAKWHLAEVCLTITGARPYLGRAVDPDGNVLDLLVPPRRDKTAAKKFCRTRLKGLASGPRVLITDKRRSDGAAKRDILPSSEHRQYRYLNHRAENSQQPTRPRERRLQGCTSPGHAPRFLSAYGLLAPHFRPRRQRCPASEYRQEMAHRCQIWREMTGPPMAAEGQREGQSAHVYAVG
jgi:putative transposase